VTGYDSLLLGVNSAKWRGMPSASHSAELLVWSPFRTLIERPPLLHHPIEGGLDDLPLRVSNEGLLRPRVARAQETV